MVTVRPYQPFDLPGMYNVCLRTGDSGQDAVHLYRNPDLLGHIYAGPYPVADPGLSFVAVDEHGVLGYIIATSDTPTFEAWLEEHWWPGLREQYPASLGEDPGDGTQDWLRIAHVHRTRPTADDLYEKYPAHMHIDILARGQRSGLGRRLMNTLTDALRARNVRGLHLGVGSSNHGAIAFYQAMGFGEERRADWGSTMVMDLQDR